MLLEELSSMCVTKSSIRALLRKLFIRAQFKVSPPTTFADHTLIYCSSSSKQAAYLPYTRSLARYIVLSIAMCIARTRRLAKHSRQAFQALFG
jgi:hypothetical protein